jgi:hypothetical protein
MLVVEGIEKLDFVQVDGWRAELLDDILSLSVLLTNTRSFFVEWFEKQLN